MTHLDRVGRLICDCGNTPEMSGFDTCSPIGERMEPFIASDWSGHYVCNECGEIVEPEAARGLVSGERHNDGQYCEYPECFDGHHGSYM